MSQLLHVILFTPDLSRMRAYYAETLGFEPEGDDPPHWVDFRTGGAVLALHPTSEQHAQHVQLSFAVDDIEAEVKAMQARGVQFEDEIHEQPYGRLVHLHDVDGNRLSLLEPAWPVKPRPGPVLSDVVLNVKDLVGGTAFYQDGMDLALSHHGPERVEFAAGATRLALAVRGTGLHRRARDAERVVPHFEIPQLDAWTEQREAAGAAFAASAGGGVATVTTLEARDPDGNVLVFRLPADEAQAGRAAEAFEDAEVTHPVGMRRRAHKAARAVSRVAVKPAYKRKKVATGKPLSATTQAVAKVRGAGPDHTRLTPKRTGDEKKAKAKPAQGRKQKADAVRAERQRTATARAGKSKPVKRAAARSSRSR